MIKLQRTLNALLSLVLMGVLLAAYYQQYVQHEKPCPLCLLQRLGMIGVAIGALLNLRFGIHTKHYAVSLLSALVGGSASLRQILLHVCPDFPVFGIPVGGLNLYTWAFIAFCSSVIVITGLLLLYSPQEDSKLPLNGLEKLAFLVVVLLTCANFITVWGGCKLGFCKDIPWPQL